jgi:hypothetical protein
LAVDEQVREALASVGDRVVVEVRRAGSDFARIAYAVGVAVGLRGVCNGGAVVGGVGATVAIGVDEWWSRDCDGVRVARRDACARTKIRGRVALLDDVVSPAPDAAIDSECDGVVRARRDA